MTDRTALPDVNVLLALIADQHEHHGAAHRWFTTTGAWATTPFTEAGLIRLMLNPTVVGGRIPGAAAVEMLRRLRAQGDHRFLVDNASLASPTIDLSALVGHRQVTDLHLVGLAASTGCVLATFDTKIASALIPSDRQHVFVIPA